MRGLQKCRNIIRRKIQIHQTVFSSALVRPSERLLNIIPPAGSLLELGFTSGAIVCMMPPAEEDQKAAQLEFVFWFESVRIRVFRTFFKVSITSGTQSGIPPQSTF